MSKGKDKEIILKAAREKPLVTENFLKATSSFFTRMFQPKEIGTIYSKC